MPPIHPNVAVARCLFSGVTISVTPRVSATAAPHIDTILAQQTIGDACPGSSQASRLTQCSITVIGVTANIINPQMQNHTKAIRTVPDTGQLDLDAATTMRATSIARMTVTMPLPYPASTPIGPRPAMATTMTTAHRDRNMRNNLKVLRNLPTVCAHTVTLQRECPHSGHGAERSSPTRR